MKMEQEPLAALYAKFKTSEAGLTNEEAERRLAEVGPNEPAHERRVGGFFQFVRFFANPLVIILLIASAVSAGGGRTHQCIHYRRYGSAKRRAKRYSDIPLASSR